MESNAFLSGFSSAVCLAPSPGPIKLSKSSSTCRNITHARLKIPSVDSFLHDKTFAFELWSTGSSGWCSKGQKKVSVQNKQKESWAVWHTCGNETSLLHTGARKSPNPGALNWATQGQQNSCWYTWDFDCRVHRWNHSSGVIPLKYSIWLNIELWNALATSLVNLRFQPPRFSMLYYSTGGEPESIPRDCTALSR